MLLKAVLLIFLIQSIFFIDGFELESYLEENKNVLFGSATPIFLAYTTSLGQYDGEEVYETVYQRYTLPRLKKKLDHGQGGSNENFSNNQTAHAAFKTEKNIVFPKILVVVDHKTYISYKRNTLFLIAYMRAFWNGVDLKFRELNDPEVRLNIAGFIINMDRRAEPYFDRDNNYFKNLSASLDNLSKYFKDKSLAQYDIVVALTNQGLQPKDFSKKIGGISKNNGACQGRLSSAIVYDAGGFDGITSVTQQLASLFGSAYDGSTGIFSEENLYCNPDDGFIMGSLWGTENKMHWSNCSLNLMQKFLKNADCLKNKPVIGTPYRKKLPGKFMNGNQQCSKIFPSANEYDKTSCTVLHCLKCINWDWFCFEYFTNYMPPADGTSCGEKSICLNGKCVADTRLYG